MIGNDIVDISLAALQSNWRRAGFLDKLFSTAEIDLILNEAHPELMVWKLWSMKESAYKADYRLKKIRKFNPKQLACKLIDSRLGEVCIGASSYKTMTASNSDFIHSIALQHNFTGGFQHKIHKQKALMDTEQLYDLLIRHVARSTDCEVEELLLRKTDDAIPELYRNKNKLKTICSMSHHGNYGAYIFTN